MLIREITSLQHPIVKHLVKLREDKRYRMTNNHVMISGVKLISELAPSFPIKTLLLSKSFEPASLIQKAEQVFSVSPEILKKVTGLQEPEPIAAEIPFPDHTELNGKSPLLILDGISDPGNLGTLLRTALALNWAGVFITPNSTDPFNEKALRAAKGSTFKIPLCHGSYQELAELLKEEKFELLIADVGGESLDAVPLPKSFALVLGNESRGVNPWLKEQGRLVRIPMGNQMESLNVAAAGAILMDRLRGSHG